MIDEYENYLVELDNLVGLENVKDMVGKTFKRLQIEKIRNPEASLAPGHYVFVGNPGTGKTTVARLMGKLFQSIGILKKGHTVEARRADLVAEYIGQTSAKTRKVLESAVGGVLFIDEAYSLVQGKQDQYGYEAAEEILAFMENRKSELSVIIAGYPEEINKFFKTNPAFQRRCNVPILFEN